MVVLFIKLMNHKCKKNKHTFTLLQKKLVVFIESSAKYSEHWTP